VLNQAVVRGGVAINVVPDRCTLDLGVRPLPGQRSHEFIDRITAELTAIDGLGRDATVTILGDTPPLLTDADCPLYKRLCEHVGQTDTVAVSYASDAGPLTALGVQSVLFGPGSIEVAHKPNEYVPRQQYVRCGQVLSDFADAWCTR
jgi:acetylornithine deacetylase